MTTAERVGQDSRATAQPRSTISIALATFNGQAFLQAQLQSLLKQHLRPDELVITDDGSTDRTLAIVEEFARRAPFPVALHRNTTRLGWRGNFIRAASLCRHALISFCDQDDIWYEHKLEEVERYFSDPNTLLVHHNADLIDRCGERFGLLDLAGAFPNHQVRLSRPTPWANPLGLTMTFRRSLLAFLPFWERSADHTAFDAPAAHDQFFYRLAINLGTVRYISTPLLAYRQHGQNAVGFSRTSGFRRTGELTQHHMALDAHMLGQFCEVLAAAQRSDPHAFGEGLVEALLQNRFYLRQIEASEHARVQPLLLQRLSYFVQLLRMITAGPGQWRLGHKRLIALGILGVLLRR